MLSKDLIQRMPKCELHCHLDGSMRVETIIDLATKQGVSLPTTDPAKLHNILVQDEAASLPKYLEAFGITCSVLQDAESLRRTSYELIEDCAKENIVYIEVRYCPLLHVEKGLKLTEVVESVLRGLREGEKDFGVRWGLIICGLRSHAPRMTLEMAELCIAYKHQGVVGFDLAGAEAGNPAQEHEDAFRLILMNNVNVTIHAGEAYGPPSISSALHQCGAHRLGHATRLIEDGDLLNYCCDHRIPLEICMTSNVQTGAITSLKDHPVRFFYDYGLRVTMNTDNRLMSGVSVADELWKAHETFGFNLAELKDMVIYGIKSAFLHHRQKVELLDKVLRDLEDFTEDSVEPCKTRNAVADIPTESHTGSRETGRFED